MEPFDIKIFGERNTGTNALTQIIEKHSASRVFPNLWDDNKRARRKKKYLNKFLRGIGVNKTVRNRAKERAIDKIFFGQPACLAWKHCATHFNDISSLEHSSIIFLVRNPISWAWSLYKNPYHLIGSPPKTFWEFLSRDWELCQRDNLPFKTLKPHALYEEKLKSYLSFWTQLEHRKIAYSVIKFEDLVINQKEVFTKISPLLKGPEEAFEPLQSSTKSSHKDLNYYIDYYGRELWRDEIGNEGEIRFISEHISSTVLKRFGYQI